MHVGPPPVGGVGKALALVLGDLVVDEVQRCDGHAGRLHRRVDPAGVVYEVQPLTYVRQRLTRQVLNGERGRRDLLPT